MLTIEAELSEGGSVAAECSVNASVTETGVFDSVDAAGGFERTATGGCESMFDGSGEDNDRR